MMCEECENEAELTHIDENYITHGTCGKCRGASYHKLVITMNLLRTVHTYFKEKELPITLYTYTKTISSKIFNFSSTLLDLDYH